SSCGLLTLSDACLFSLSLSLPPSFLSLSLSLSCSLTSPLCHCTAPMSASHTQSEREEQWTGNDSCPPSPISVSVLLFACLLSFALSFSSFPFLSPFASLSLSLSSPSLSCSLHP